MDTRQEIAALLKNVQTEVSPGLRWDAVNKDLDMMEDKETDGIGLPVDGSVFPKEGKYKKGKQLMNMTMHEVYKRDKSYVDWVRNHINTESSREMQYFKLYVLTRDQQKRQRLTNELGAPSGSVERPKAAAKAKMVATKTQPARLQEEEETNMEWHFVMDRPGRHAMIVVTMDGLPLTVVDPQGPMAAEQVTVMVEMYRLLKRVLPAEVRDPEQFQEP